MTDDLPYRNPELPASQRIADLLGRMTLEEKVGQMMQFTSSTITSIDRRKLMLGPDRIHEAVTIDESRLYSLLDKYKIGSILNTFGDFAQSREYTAELVSKIQKASMEKIGIPCLYGMDMIHGASYLSDGTLFP